LEQTGRSRQFVKQARYLDTLNNEAGWPYVACVHSLAQPDIDPAPLLEFFTRRHPPHPLAKLCLARLVSQTGETAVALTLVEQVIPAYPELSKAAYTRSLLLAASNDISTAIEAMDHVAQQGMLDKPLIRTWLGLSLSYPAGWSHALERIRHAAALAPDSPRFKAELAAHALIIYWATGQIETAYQLVKVHHAFQDMPKQGGDNALQVFFRYCLYLCVAWQHNQEFYSNVADKPLWVIGESHSLTSANFVFPWQGARVKGLSRFIMGIKMWHVVQPSDNYHRVCLQAHLDALPTGADVLLTIGEIDCRPNEGIWLTAKKKNRELDDLIITTVDGYVSWLVAALAGKTLASVTIQGIPAPGYTLKGDRDPGDKDAFLAMIASVNERLKVGVLAQGWHFLDVYAATVDDNGLSNRQWHLDGWHLTPAFYSRAMEWITVACP
jgi:hypothetical protein